MPGGDFALGINCWGETGGTYLSAVHNIHTLFFRTNQMSPDRCATSVLAYC